MGKRTALNLPCGLKKELQQKKIEMSAKHGIDYNWPQFFRLLLNKAGSKSKE